MNEKDIVEGNVLIAEFMDITWKDISIVNYPSPNKNWLIKFPKGQEFEKYGNINEIISKMVKYHTSWDWLQMVIEKIKKWYDNDSDINFIELAEVNLKIFDLKITASIKESWHAVIQFIKWYNSQTLKPTNT